MIKVEDAETHCKYLTSGNDKRRKMLFELLDHTINKHLSNSSKKTHQEEMEQEQPMRKDELDDVIYL
jgi:hypothetical protein